MPQKKTETEFKIKRFKDGSNNWWINTKHFTILYGKLFFAAGGEPTEEEIEKATAYLKRNKVEFEL